MATVGIKGLIKYASCFINPRDTAVNWQAGHVYTNTEDFKISSEQIKADLK